MALTFTVIGKTNDKELIAEELYYTAANKLGFDCQLAAKTREYKDDRTYYQRKAYLPRIPHEYVGHFIELITKLEHNLHKEAA